MEKEKKVIMYDSFEAATKVVLNLEDGTYYGKGWVSSNRQFFVTEEMARHNSATHKKCECGEVYEARSYCKSCSRKRRIESYYKMPYKEWDGKTILAMHDGDEFFNDMDQLADYCENHEIDSENLMLVICEPNKLEEVTSEIWADIMPEDGEGYAPQEVENKLKELNEVIKKQGPVSWSAGKYRTTVTLEQ